MPITANYNAETQRLTISGDADDDTITVTRDEAGNLLVNGGSVTITGGTPTVSNTDQIDVFGGDGEDSITTDDLPILPRLYGEGGNDFLMGRAWFYGGAGNDTLIGLGETQSYFEGGDGDDTLVASYDAILLHGDGFQYMIGGLGNDWYYVINGMVLIGMGQSYGDHVVEQDGEGYDRILARVSYSAEHRSIEVLSPADVAGTAGVQLGGSHLDNQIYGSFGNDMLYGIAGSDTIIAHDGDDLLNGGTGADSMSGGGGNDTLIGHDGNDTLDGGAGADAMSGGLGNDWFYVDAVDDIVDEAAGPAGGIDRIFASTSYVLATGIPVETLSTNDTAATIAIDLTGNEWANHVYGNYGNNSLFGGARNDMLIGHDGHDTLNGGTGTDTMSGGLGDDRFYVDSSTDIVNETAGEGDDHIFASSNYVLAAEVSIETLSTDNATGTTAITLIGNELANTVHGNYGNNSLFGSGGNDMLAGHGGDDTLNGGTGIDAMSGGLGNDWYYVNSSTDVVNEVVGEGTDRIFTSSNYVLAAGVSVETLSTDFAGGTTAITLIGNELANNVYGNYGNNSLYGSSGNDTLIAHDGADLLNGGAGADSLTGGTGADTFVFANTAGPGNIDSIGDYVVADDVIHIDNAIFTGLAAGALAAGAFHTGAAAADADDRVIYTSATGALWFDADGNGAGAAVQFAALSAGLAMTAGEFVVV